MKTVNLYHETTITWNKDTNQIKSYLLQHGTDNEMRIKDILYKEMAAMDVFSLSMKYLKDHMEEAIRKNNEDAYLMKYVLTVPSLWDDAAKQFMKEAAINVSHRALYVSVML